MAHSNHSPSATTIDVDLSEILNVPLTVFANYLWKHFEVSEHEVELVAHVATRIQKWVLSVSDETTSFTDEYFSSLLIKFLDIVKHIELCLL